MSDSTTEFADTEEHSRSALVIGLGNPGDEYRDTRHNLGFRVVDELASRLGIERWQSQCNALVATHDAMTLVKPLTFMNRSGFAARCLLEQGGLATDSVLVVYDEVRLPLGRLRLRPSGSPGGHRGMASIIESLRSTEIARLRMGCGPREEDLDGEALVDYVLSPFEESEIGEVDELVAKAADAVETWFAGGVANAMNRFNG